MPILHVCNIYTSGGPFQHSFTTKTNIFYTMANMDYLVRIQTISLVYFSLICASDVRFRGGASVLHFLVIVRFCMTHEIRWNLTHNSNIMLVKLSHTCSLNLTAINPAGTCLSICNPPPLWVSETEYLSVISAIWAQRRCCSCAVCVSGPDSALRLLLAAATHTHTSSTLILLNTH